MLHVLRAHLAYRPNLDGELSYWASDQVEVDFLLSTRSGVLAIDATTSVRLHDSDFRGLQAVSRLNRAAGA